ncbi:hypothetical protein L0Y59_04455 [Candidatus Uhrbacteria bacterium]|nr:hypothetical protein [Candidatus Uhrbacteria bacterium]
MHCIHCGEEYDSYRIEWRVERDADGQEHGFWCCPIPGCDGMGFGFDIFPVDPDYRDENGELMWCSDEDEFEDDDFEDGELAEFDEDDEDEDEDEEPWLFDEEAPSPGARSDRDEDMPF